MENRFRLTLAAAGIFAGLGMATACQAEEAPKPGYDGPCMWQQMTPEQQRQMLENMHSWGYGPGMMGGYGPGYGMGSGMMGGYGPGSGMGPGMMGGGQGYGMRRGWAGLDLSDAQSEQMEKIRGDLFEKHRRLMNEMWDEEARLADLYSADKRDATAIGKSRDKLARLQREALDARIDAENKAADILTKEQKARLRRGSGWGMMGY